MSANLKLPIGANSVALLKSASTGVGAKEKHVAMNARINVFAILLAFLLMYTDTLYFLRVQMGN
jgi:hypothetical protein